MCSKMLSNFETLPRSCAYPGNPTAKSVALRLNGDAKAHYDIS